MHCPRNIQSPRLLTQAQAARVMGVSLRRVQEERAAGRLAWVPVGRRAGLDDLHIHDLRHTCATWLRQAGASLEDIGALLRHQSPTMTARYAHAEPEQARAAVERLAPPRDGNDAGCYTRTWRAS